MNTNPATLILQSLNDDAGLISLRRHLVDVETQLADTKREIAQALGDMQARQQGDIPSSVGDYVATLLRPTLDVAALRSLVKERRAAEGRLAEAASALRRMVRSRENAAFIERLGPLREAQVALGGKALDHLIALAELTHEEEALRSPLRVVSRFEQAAGPYLNPVPVAALQERLRALQRLGYSPTSEQLQRIEALQS